ncbi:MAG: hypothetical protein ABFS46_18475, partial [Myxococcota bacterium]
GRPEEARRPISDAWQAYAALGPQGVALPAVARYAGLEMLRRTIGAARVAAVEGDEAGLAVLEVAVRLIRQPPDSPGRFPA